MTYPVPMLQRRLHRNTINKWVGGVFQGVADTYGWDVTLLRVLFVGSSFLLPGPQWVLYVLAWIITPPN